MHNIAIEKHITGMKPTMRSSGDIDPIFPELKNSNIDANTAHPSADAKGLMASMIFAASSSQLVY